jgi:type VI secretion system protein ImpK
MSLLADAYTDVFAVVFAFRAAPDDERPDYGAFRARVMRLLTDAQRRAEDTRKDPRGYAHYAAVALVDETVMNSEWFGAEQWRREPLQMHYFGDFLAGEQFFDRLDELASGADTELLEVYFTCLCAGFRGMFRDDAGALAGRRQKLYRQLTASDDPDPPHLTEAAYGRNLERSLTRSRFPAWWLAPFVVGAAALYAAFYTVLSDQVRAMMHIGG